MRKRSLLLLLGSSFFGVAFAERTVTSETSPSVYVPLMSRGVVTPEALESESQILHQNVHGARSAGKTAPGQKRIEGVTQIDSLQYGLFDGVHYLTLYGQFDRGNDLRLDCGGSRLSGPVQTTWVSPGQINVFIPNNYLERRCSIRGSQPEDKPVEFVLPGLTCETHAPLCVGSERYLFETNFSTTNIVRVPIRDGAEEGAMFTESELLRIRFQLRNTNPDHLRYVTRAQAVAPGRLAAGETVVARAGQGGILYLRLYDDRSPLSYAEALADLVFQQQPAEDRNEFRGKLCQPGRERLSPVNVCLPDSSEALFSLLYRGWWIGDINFQPEDLLAVAMDESSPRADRVEALRLVLLMSSYFYNAEQDYVRYYSDSLGEQRVNVDFKSDRIELDNLVLMYTDGKITSIIPKYGTGTPIAIDPVAIPSRFLRTFPRR